MTHRFHTIAIRGLAGLVLAALAGATACGAKVVVIDERQACLDGGGAWDGTKCVEEEPPALTTDRCYETCDAEPSFRCIPTCDPDDATKIKAELPSCVGDAWVCPPEKGFFPSTLCATPGGGCGGVENLPCPPGSYCSYGEVDDGTCGRSGQTGTCVAHGGGCEYYKEPVCSCGGWTNSNPGCGPDDHPFQPGATYATCDDPPPQSPRCGMWLGCTGSRFCVRTPSAVAGIFDYECKSVSWSSDDDPKTAACATLDHPCAANCSEVDGMVIVTCECTSPANRASPD
jgi:hypothetical protein